ncbi:MAG: 4Fe-4S binding protein [Synergistaceae bacterium]|jgi:indolepyruvate ferredoxin oxidoreductase alpha subunit|nr:4Fe-4S binding protein [Synergistaceae bacterium]
MKKPGEILMRQEPFQEAVMGNFALARAMIESGVRVITSYPGSPTPEIATALTSVPREERPFYFEFSVNEKVAAEVAFGASVNGRLSCVFFKSVGVNVASDSLVQLPMMELIGGLVVVFGDDPGANSSQNEQDNRHFARMAMLPMLEPSSPSEAYTMFLEAVRLSREKHMPIALRMATHTCHAKELVSFGKRPPVETEKIPRFSVENGPYIPLAKDVMALKRRALRKLEDFRACAERSSFNKLYPGDKTQPGQERRGVIVSGLPGATLLDLLDESPARPGVLHLGVVHPVPKDRIAEFLRENDEVRVIEELDNFLELEVRALANERGIGTKIRGKTDVEDWIGEYLPDRIAEILNRTWNGVVPAPAARTSSQQPRPPQLCPGCGHRSAFYAIAKALEGSAITVADIGCHTLGYLPPCRMGEVLLSMGHCSGTASGLALLNDEKPVVAFLGDSTFFHAGIPGIINALFNGHNFILVVMENGTTAMTGHQDHPGSGGGPNDPAEAIPLKRVLEGLGVRWIREVDTYSQAKLTAMIREAVEARGFRVVIARHPCMLKATKEAMRRPGYEKKHVEIGQKCTRIQECIGKFGCPSFQRDSDGSIVVNPELCIGDGSCVQTCPARAISLSRSSKGDGKQ